MFTIYKFQSFGEAWFDTVVEFMIESSCLSNTQLRFMSVNHSIFSTIEAISEVQWVFLDFTKEFGIVCNNSVLNKLKNDGIKGAKVSALVVSINLLKIKDLAYQWKKSFNLERTNKRIILRKINRIMYPPLHFNNANLRLTHTWSTLTFS